MIIRGRIALGAFLLLIASGALLSSRFSQADMLPQTATVIQFAITNQAPAIGAESYYVIDLDTQEVLAESAADVVHPIASVTKLPAAAAWLQQMPLEATTTVLWSDVVAEGRAGKLQYGDVYTYHDVLFPLLLESSNDAAALMERVGDGAVVSGMNELVDTLSLAHTSFVDASGLSPENVSTARELAALVSFIKETSPHVFDITNLTQYIHEEVGWVNNSPLINEAAYKGGKHGFTYEANRTVAAVFEESFAAADREVLYVVLGSDDIRADVDALRQFVHESVRYE